MRLVLLNFPHMKVKSFVCGSALILTAWLGVTFVHEVSPRQYPTQRKASSAARGTPEQAPAPATPAKPDKGMATAETAR